MKAFRLEQPGQLVATELPPAAAPDEGEALVRVHRIGVCGTDIHAFGGRQPFFTYPRILGHELAVEVLACHDASGRISPGLRCAVEPYLNCGRCIACRRGRGNCCTGLQVLGVHTDGGMREQFVVPAAKLHPSDRLSWDQLALVETLGIGCHAVDRAQIEPGEFALVIGAGPIGLAVAQFAAEAGAQVIMQDVNRARLDFYARHFADARLIDLSQGAPPLDALARFTGGDLPTVVFDATGNSRSMQAAFDFPAHGGRLVFVGLFQGDVTFNDPNFHRRELTLLASRNARSSDFRRIIALIEHGRIDTNPWITHRAPFARIAEEFPAWTRPESGVVKAMIEL